MGSFELLMLLIRSSHQADAEHSADIAPSDGAPALAHDEPRAMLSLEQTVRERHSAGHSQRTIARDLRIDRRKVKQIIDGDAA